MNTPDHRVRIIRCPGCGGDSVYATENAFRPFCSSRCKNQDFGAWASGQYAVESQPAEGDEGDLGAVGPEGKPHVQH